MRRLLTYTPFSYMWTLRRIADDPETVLDLGCGDGELMKVIADRRWIITGVDLHNLSVKQAKSTKLYNRVIKGDLVEVCKMLIRKKKKFDLVFCSQAIEHLMRAKGEKLLSLADELAKRRIYFGTPRGYMNQPEEFLGENPYQVHKSGWTEDDFKKRGYKTFGVGFKPIWSERGIARREGGILKHTSTIISYIMSPITYYVPSLGSGIMAVKDK